MVALQTANESYLIPPEEIARDITSSIYPQVAEQNRLYLPRFHSVSRFCRDNLNQLLSAAESPYVTEIIAANPDLKEAIEKAQQPRFKRILEMRARLGNFIHSTIPKLDTTEEPELWGQAEQSITNYRAWKRIHNVQYTIAQEQCIFSKKLQFAGTPDFIGIVDGISTIIDYKIGNTVHPVNQQQVQAYGMLVAEEMGFVAQRVCILLLPTTKDSGPQFIEYTLQPEKIEEVHKLVEVWHEYIPNPELLHHIVPPKRYAPDYRKSSNKQRDQVV